MKDFVVTLPSGRTITVTAPEGTPKEQVLAEAARKASGGSAGYEYNPSDAAREEFASMPMWQQALVGAGNQFNQLQLGVRDLNPFDDDSALKAQIEADRPYSDATWSGMGAAGNIAGIVAPALAVPVGGSARAVGGALSRIGMRGLGSSVGTSLAADGALTGAAFGALQPTTEDESTAGRMAVGAIGGGIGGKVAGMIGERLARPAVAPGISNAQLGARRIDQQYPGAAQRLMQAGSLPRPIALDAGQATGDEAIQTSVHAARHMLGGGALQKSWNAQDELLRGNIDELITRTGGVANYSSGVGGKTNAGANVGRWYENASNIAKRRASLLFKMADRREGAQPADNLTPLLGHLYENAYKGADANSSMPAILALLGKYGISIGEDGIPRAGDRVITLSDLNSIRQSVSQLASAGGTAGYDAGQVLGALNDTFLANRGTLYPRAVRAWKDWATEFTNKESAGRIKEALARGDAGPGNFATERLIDTIASKSVTVRDIEKLKSSMLKVNRRSGQVSQAGARAWRNLQADVLDLVRSGATRGDREATEFSAAKLNQSIVDSIGIDKLRAILGDDLVRELMNVNDVAQMVKNVARTPGTTPALMNMASDLPYVGALAGVANKSLPIAKAAYAARQYGPQYAERSGKKIRDEMARELMMMRLRGSVRDRPSDYLRAGGLRNIGLLGPELQD